VLLLAVLAFFQGASPAFATAAPDNTWVALATLPERLEAPVLALAVNPVDNSSVLAGTGAGSIYRSADGGASWQSVQRGLGRGVTTIQFSPFKTGLVFAGTRGDGLWRSADGGATWIRQPGLPAATFRTIGFSKSTTLAGSDAGLYATRDTVTWTAFAPLLGLSVDALAVPAVNDPPRFLAGADGSKGTEALPLYLSPDGGLTWNPIKALGSSTLVGAAAAAGVAPAGGNRPLLVGTNNGAFLSTDNGAAWTQLSGLPAIDFSAAAFSAGHADRFYLASDGGATESGGLWTTSNNGQDFRPLDSPVGSVTALAVSADEQPLIYTATFRPLDHAVMLWSYRDTGGRPNPPAGGVVAATGPATTGTTRTTAAAKFTWQRLARGPEAPYLGLAVLSGVVLLFALVLQLRRRGD